MITITFIFEHRSGSIVVDYRVTWDDDEDLSDEVLMNTLSTYLKENHGYIYSYFVPTETLSYTKVIDSCAMQLHEMQLVHLFSSFKMLSS